MRFYSSSMKCSVDRRVVECSSLTLGSNHGLSLDSPLTSAKLLKPLPCREGLLELMTPCVSALLYCSPESESKPTETLYSIVFSETL